MSVLAPDPLVRCSRCGHVGPLSTFPQGRDFFQHAYVSACPKACGNAQTPGDASMRGFGGARPFVFVEAPPPSDDPLTEVMRRQRGAS